MQTQYSVLDYRFDLYFDDYKLAIEIDETEHSDLNIDYEIKKQKATEQELNCEFIRIDPDKEDFNIFKDYLCHKLITSQNVSSEAQVKNFFMLQKSYVSFLRCSSFCIFNHPMIYQICDAMMIINT